MESFYDIGPTVPVSEIKTEITEYEVTPGISVKIRKMNRKRARTRLESKKI